MFNSVFLRHHVQIDNFDDQLQDFFYPMSMILMIGTNFKSFVRTM